MRYFTSISVDKRTFIKAIVFGVLSSVATIVVLMSILSAVLNFSGLLPYEYLQYILLAVDAIGVLFGSYIAARISKSQGLILGLINGAIVFIALLICGFCVNSGTITLITLLKALVILLFSSFGGVKGVNVKEKIRIK